MKLQTPGTKFIRSGDPNDKCRPFFFRQMKRLNLHRSNWSSAAGFTLPELLVATIIAALLTAVTAQVMISQLLEGRRLEQAQRLRENTSRLSYLVQIEASEADEISDSEPLSAGCGGVGPSSIVTLWVPRTEGPYADPDNRSPVHYYNAGSDIWRCGPRVTQNGVLIHGVLANGHPDLVSGPVLRYAQLVVDDANCSELTTDNQLAYSVDFPNAQVPSGDAANCVVATARSTFVCNPPLLDPSDPSYVPLIGDCP